MYVDVIYHDNQINIIRHHINVYKRYNDIEKLDFAIEVSKLHSTIIKMKKLFDETDKELSDKQDVAGVGVKLARNFTTILFSLEFLLKLEKDYTKRLIKDYKEFFNNDAFDGNKQINAMCYALAFYLECIATGNEDKLYKQKQVDLERELKNFSSGSRSGNTIRKQLVTIREEGKEFLNKTNLENTIGEQWKDLVLSISRKPNEISKLLKSKGL